jgi:hypothetical protein
MDPTSAVRLAELSAAATATATATATGYTPYGYTPRGG